MRFDSINAREMALKSHAAKAMRVEREKLAIEEAANTPQLADWKAEICRKHVHALNLLYDDLIKHHGEPDEARAYAQAIAAHWVAWHSASGEARPGLTKGNKGRPQAMPLPTVPDLG